MTAFLSGPTKRAASACLALEEGQKYFPFEYGNFPLPSSKIIVINLKVEGGGFSAHAKLPRPLASLKCQEFTSAEDTDWAWLIL